METLDIPYWHVWVDSSGLTHQTRRALATSLSPGDWHGIAKLLTSDIDADVNQQQIIVLLPGVVFAWHENPYSQWIVPLSGRWFVETLDGVRVEMGPGEISLGEDQGSATIEGRTGHQSGAIGDSPCVLLLIQRVPGQPV